jgi:YhcH/YjgK/YiaL family protein
MILDDLQYAANYHVLGPRFARAFDYLRTTDFSKLADGKYEVEGSDVFAMVQSYQTKAPDQGKWEAHRKYADIQCVITGSERIGVAPIHTMVVTENYEADRDAAFFSGAGQFVTVRASQFAIFLPHDVHMPSLMLDRAEGVKKVVMKVRL